MAARQDSSQVWSVMPRHIDTPEGRLTGRGKTVSGGMAPIQCLITDAPFRDRWHQVLHLKIAAGSPHTNTSGQIARFKSDHMLRVCDCYSDLFLPYFVPCLYTYDAELDIFN
jgi:hypothetical protein